MNNFNMDENSMNKLKDMMNSGDISNIISQIPPDVMQNFSSMMSSNNLDNSNKSGNSANSNNANNSNNFGNSTNSSKNSNSSNSNNISGNFDFSNIDMNTILKMKSVIDKMNSSNDPRSNLLYSLKPYLRDQKKEKLDQYANLLNFAKIFEALKTDNKETNHNE